MALSPGALLPPLLLLLTLASHACMGSRHLAQSPSNLITYHNGRLLNGVIPISILWYGSFTHKQKSILSDFILSLTPSQTGLTHRNVNPSVSQWWNTINNHYITKAMIRNTPKRAHILLSNQFADVKCSMGRLLKRAQISDLAAMAKPKKGGISIVFTSQDVAVEGFCVSSCGLHGSDAKAKTAYIWVGNSAIQCPGQCAWPFHQPLYGPQTLPLVAPNGDVGVDGMVINTASMLAGAATNPFGDGYYEGLPESPLEAATACSGVYGKGAYPGYAGDLLIDAATRASYNANGINGRKYLLPALLDPSTSACSTLV